jgi:hypothetical protein
MPMVDTCFHNLHAFFFYKSAEARNLAKVSRKLRLFNNYTPLMGIMNHGDRLLGPSLGHEPAPMIHAYEQGKRWFQAGKPVESAV